MDETLPTVPTMEYPPAPPVVFHVARRRKPRRNLRRAVALSAIAAAALLAVTVTPTGMQDVASLSGRELPVATRWLARLVAVPTGAEYLPTKVTDARPVYAAAAGIEIEPTFAVGTRGIASAPPFKPPHVNRDAKRDAAMTRSEAAPRRRITAGVLRQDMQELMFGPAKSTTAIAMLMPPAAANAAVASATMPKPVASPSAVLAAVAGAARKAATAPTDGLAAQAYADPDAGATSTAPFDAVLAKPMALGKDGKPDHWWVMNPIPVNARSKTEQKCLATAIYFEARGETVKGELAVAQVVINRLKNPAYPNTICGVVYQNKDMRDACQFSFACDGIKDRITDMTSWKRAQELARRVVTQDNWWNADVGSSTHYHANYVKPRWARTMKKMEKIGHHIFYKTFGGGWI